MTHTSNTTNRISVTRCLAQLAMAGIISGMGIIAAPSLASAQSFLQGQSSDMRKCVNAILRGPAVKRVKVHGHHFNCKPLYRSTRRIDNSYLQVINISHNQRFGRDDQVQLWFRVDADNVIRPNSQKIAVNKGYSLKEFFRFEFKGYRNPLPATVVRDYAFYAAAARRIRPRSAGSWRSVPN